MIPPLFQLKSSERVLLAAIKADNILHLLRRRKVLIIIKTIVAKHLQILLNVRVAFGKVSDID